MKNKGFTLIELLTVIAILVVIMLIAAPIILGVLDKARKNTFKNQVLLYVEGLKQQAALSMMGQGNSKLNEIDNTFYVPTVNTEITLSRVSITSLNMIMETKNLNDGDNYLYIEYNNGGYKYYIGENITNGSYKTTCEYATGTQACVTKTYNEESINLIEASKLALIHISKNGQAGASSLSAENITFSTDTSSEYGATKTNVQDAIDDLASKLN